MKKINAVFLGALATIGGIQLYSENHNKFWIFYSILGGIYVLYSLFKRGD